MEFKNEQAEASVIAKMIMLEDPYAIAEQLKPEDFTADEYREAFVDLSSMLDAGQSLKGNPMAIRVGLKATVNLDGDMMVSDELVEAIKNLSQRRSLLDATIKLGDALQDSKLTSESLIEYASAVIEGAKDERIAGTNVASAFDCCTKLLKQMEVPESKNKQVFSGMPYLDHFGAMYGGDMITIAGRTGAGKTAFAKAMALSMLRDNIPVGYICKEMTAEQFMTRIVAEIANVNSLKIRSGELTDEEKSRYYEALSIAGKMNFMFSNARSIEGALRDCRRWREKYGTEAFFFDYAQQFSTSKNLQTRERIMHISESIKFFGLDNGVVTLPLAQINRSAVNQGKPIPPRVDHLKESGSLEEDSDRVYMLWNARKEFEANGRGDDGSQPMRCWYRREAFELNQKTPQGDDLVALFCRKYRGGEEFQNVLGFKAPTTSFYLPEINSYQHG